MGCRYVVLFVMTVCISVYVSKLFKIRPITWIRWHATNNISMTLIKKARISSCSKNYLGKSLSSDAPSECDWKTGVICSADSYTYKDFKLT